MKILSSVPRAPGFLWILLAGLFSPELFAAHPMEWQPVKMGDIFEIGEKVEIPLRVDADEVEWKITNFWVKEIEAGTLPVTENKAVLQPRIKEPGYYLIHAIAKKNGVSQPTAYASFAIVRPHQARDPANSPFGVMTHFAQGMDPAMLPLFSKIGIASIRDEHYWAQVEETGGVYKFPEKSDAYMKACQGVGILPLVAMTFGNKLYDDQEGPSTPAGFEGYGNYGQAILKKYGDEIHWLEIWNEYNGSWAPPPARKDLESRYTTYTEMLKIAYRHIKEIRPDVQVLGGASVLIPLPYFEGIFKLGGLDFMDAVAIHPYRDEPEGVDLEVDELQQLIRKYNQGRDKPVWVTETGRHSKDEYDWEKGARLYEKGRAEGARYLPRIYTLLLKQKVAKIYWYLASDHADFVSMGLLRHHSHEDSGMPILSPGPVYVSYANFIQQMDGADFVEREAFQDYSHAYVYQFQRGNETIRVCWATQPSKIRIKTEGELLVSDLMGNESRLTPVKGEAVVDLDEDVLYIHGPATEITEVGSGNRVIASSLNDYSKNQGEKNWYYGYFAGDQTFQELKQVETAWGNEWGGVSQFLKITSSKTHPDKGEGIDLVPVLRWKSPVEGKLRIRGSWANEGQGDGVTAGIQVDGKEVWSRPVGVAGVKQVEVDQLIEVRTGSLVDFTLKPNANTSYDVTTREFSIIQEK